MACESIVLLCQEEILMPMWQRKGMSKGIRLTWNLHNNGTSERGVWPVGRGLRPSMLGPHKSIPVR